MAMSDTVDVTPAQVVDVVREAVTEHAIEKFRAALSKKYEGVTDRELLELTAHNSEMTRHDVSSVMKMVKPAMESIADGGIMGLLTGGKKKRGQ